MCIYRESYLHWWVFVIRCSTRCEFNGCYSDTPDVCFKFIATNLVIQKKKDLPNRKHTRREQAI